VTKAIFISSIVLFLIAIAMMFIPGLLSSGQDTNTTATTEAVCLCPAILVLLLSIIIGVQELVLILTTEFAVTNQRIIAKRGFIRRHTLEILLSKIESVAVNQRDRSNI
jgi:uncharacterized membrane protein YdbT with pleckstrin-like domain